MNFLTPSIFESTIILFSHWGASLAEYKILVWELLSFRALKVFAL